MEMLQKRKLRFLALIVAVLAAGCAPVISKKVLETAQRDIPFSELAKDPMGYKGSTVLLGGTILKTDNLEAETVMEVLAQPLSRTLRPVRPEESPGRFLVVAEGFLDPALYAPGRPITVVGVVEGVRKGVLGEHPYAYPVISPVELHLWRDERRPDITIGVGVYGSF